jgi:MoxR-like ATPase
MGPEAATLTPEQAGHLAEALCANVERALRGKPEIVRRSLVTLLAGGHLLLEDVPGVGKTTLARALAASLRASFRRIQFTSDLLPSDVLGLSVPEMQDGRPSGRFVFQPGPLFAHIVLADEVNRASPKSQSALLEAMGDASITVDGTTHVLPDPFFVIATQNPLEHHGTHPLPESQLDRFLMRVRVGYPSREFEAAVLRDDPATTELPRLEPVVSLEQLRGMRRLAALVKFDDALVAYLLDVVNETREHEALELGVSPRGAVALRRAAQAHALLEGRDFCIPDDVRDLAPEVLAHRLSVEPGSSARRGSEETLWVLREILDRVPVPR